MMRILDAKMIDTKSGLETYLDIQKNVHVADLRIPTEESPFFEIKIGIEYYRLIEQNYYDIQVNYFWIRIHPEMNTITLLEPEIQNIFSIKDVNERVATKKLIGEWLINTNAFRSSIKNLIKEKKSENVVTEKDIRETLRTIELLEKTLDLKTEDILNAEVKKAS
ncbi:hypothetical protein E1I69_08615 [Bacillus timonensis]|uniref:Uncharacterized protein n=1 Tax=Bacillus timonensis TaxID=1033734 RepID=A0A4S3PVZ9_9BACI|nr:hypothetical protein [Bacillus timonensis]THE13152.1 hypothetical protein E1I69_08615 [Bacillus timonensis]